MRLPLVRAARGVVQVALKLPLAGGGRAGGVDDDLERILGGQAAGSGEGDDRRDG